MSGPIENWWIKRHQEVKDAFEPLKADSLFTEPPCAKCNWWQPRVFTDSTGTFGGVSCCQTRDAMKRDFTCFVPRPKESD